MKESRGHFPWRTSDSWPVSAGFACRSPSSVGTTAARSSGCDFSCTGDLAALLGDPSLEGWQGIPEPGRWQIKMGASLRLSAVSFKPPWPQISRWKESLLKSLTTDWMWLPSFLFEFPSHAQTDAPSPSHATSAIKGLAVVHVPISTR